MDQFNNTTFCGENEKVTESTNYILDTLSTENTQQALMHASRIFHRMRSTQGSKSA